MGAAKSPAIQMKSKNLNIKTGDKKKIALRATNSSILKKSKLVWKSSKFFIESTSFLKL